MRIYTKIIIDIESGLIVETEGFEYDGEVARCGGGQSGGGTSYDPAYNAGMLELSKEQQDWARQMFNQYSTGTTTGDAAPAGTTSEMQYQQNVVNANQALLPLQTEAEKAQLADTTSAIAERAPVRSAMYDTALNGIDIGSRMNEAQATVEHAFGNAQDQIRRSSMNSGGMDPTSIASLNTGMNLEKAKSIAGARTVAKTTAEEEQFNRLRSAMAVV